MWRVNRSIVQMSWIDIMNGILGCIQANSNGMRWCESDSTMLHGHGVEQSLSADLTRGGEVEDRGDRGTEKDRGERERYPVREIKKIERGMQRFGF
jgi:hypothetical protein